MSIYANIEKISGLAFGVVITIVDLSDHNPEAPNYINIDSVTPTPLVDWFYDIEANLFMETLPIGISIPKGSISPIDFWFGDRITDNELGKIFALMDNDGGGITLTVIERGRLKAFILFSLSNAITLDHPNTEFIFNALETVGVLAPGRATEILEK